MISKQILTTLVALIAALVLLIAIIFLNRNYTSTNNISTNPVAESNNSSIVSSKK